MKLDSCVYSITTLDGEQYIGSTVNLTQRRRTHLFELRRRKHHSITLQAAFDKDGAESLVFVKLLVCEPHELEIRELQAIEMFSPSHNISANTKVRRGYSLTDEHKAKIRRAANRMTDEHKAKIGASRIGRKHSDVTRQRIADGITGRVLSDESKAKIGDANRGRVFSDDHRAKISESIRQRSVLTRQCAHCETQFETRSRRAKFCSSLCKQRKYAKDHK